MKRYNKKTIMPDENVVFSSFYSVRKNRGVVIESDLLSNINSEHVVSWSMDFCVLILVHFALALLSIL